MSKILAVLATTDTPQPSGQTFGGGYLFKFDDVAQLVLGVQVTSDDLPDGDHTFTAQALDTNNAAMGDAISSTFTLAGGQIVIPSAPVPPAPPAPPATFPAPSSVSFSVVAS